MMRTLLLPCLLLAATVSAVPTPEHAAGSKTVYVAGATAPASDVLVRDDDAAGAAAPEPLLRRDEAVPAAETPAVDSSAAEPPAAAGGDVAAPNGTNHFFGSYRNALYFTNWGIYGTNYQPQQLPVDKITHILYSFADIAPDGEVKSSDTYADLEKHYPTDSWNDVGKNAYGCVKQLFLHKKANRHLKVLLSIGGWTYSPKFVPVAATESGRHRFCSSAVTLVKDWGFDGIDIDWEYPANPKESRDFVYLVRECRRQLDEYAAAHASGYHFLITIASPAGPQNYENMDFAAMDPFVDSWHLMAYDYAGSWDSTSGHQANIFPNPTNPAATKFNTEQAVEAHIRKGIRPSKIVLGMPLYGRSFEATGGIGQPYNGIGGGSIQSGVWLYKDLPKPGAQELWDDIAVASYSYDPTTRELITYDTLRSAAAKTDYLRRRGLGGAVYWEAAGDRVGPESLVRFVSDAMGPPDRSQNLLSYPASIYDNIRAGMPGS